MFKSKVFFFLISLYLSALLFTAAPAQILSGYVFSTQKEPLAGVNVYLSRVSNGTITNADGYYSLRLLTGQHEIIFSYIGYLNDTIRTILKANQRVKRTIFLQEHALHGSAIYVFAKQYNDAEEIVAKTIENKNRYLNSIQNYEYEAYQKTVIRVDTKNKKRMIGGILETKSNGYFLAPDHFQEVMLASRQSKNFSQLTNVLAIGRIPNLLEESLTFDEMRVLSPLSTKALNYYQYQMTDTTFLDTKMVFNLTFKPRYKALPLFSGKMSIVDGDFAVIACELNGGKQVVTKIRDQIHITQHFRVFKKKFWFPTEMRMNSRISLDIPGLPYLYWEQHALISGYRINQVRFSHSFDENQLKYRPVPESQRAAIWSGEQIIPLDTEERGAMAYIDSAVTHGNLLTRTAIWTMANFDKLLITQFYDFYHFNRVQGHYGGIGLDSRRTWDDLRIRLLAGYGFADKRSVYEGSIEKLWSRKRFKTGLSYYNRLVFADGLYRYNPSDITTQALTRGNDYADYLYRRGWELNGEVRLSDQLHTGINYFNYKDEQAFNTQSWKDHLRPGFLAEPGNFRLLEWYLNADDLKYFDFGWLVAPDMSQDFYDFQFRYLKNIGLETESFERYYIYFSLFRKAPPWINFYFHLNAGLVTGSVPGQFQFHLPGAYGSFGNPVLFRSITRDRYLGDQFMVLALENNFKNTVFNLFHVPYLKQSKLDLILFTNIGWLRATDVSAYPYNAIHIGNTPLAEAGISIGNIFTFLRLDATWRLSYKSGQNFYFNLTSRLFIR